MPIWHSFAIGLTTFVAGCSFLTQKPPQIEVADVALTSVGLFNQSLSVTLCVTNPNGTRISFKGVSFTIAIAESPFARGATEFPVAVPAGASVLVPVVIETTMRNLPEQVISTLATGSVAYRLSGVVRLASLPFDVPFSRYGRFSVLEAGQQYADTAAGAAKTRCELPPSLVGITR